MKKTYLLTIIPALLAFAFIAYAQDAKQAPAGVDAKQQTESAANPSAGAMKEKRFVATTGPDGIQHVQITGGEYYFDPNYIVVKVNVPVELIVKKTGHIPHDIVVKAPDAGMDFKVDLKKEPRTVNFTPTRVGKYEMICDQKLLFFKSHKDRGMHGVIEVVQ